MQMLRQTTTFLKWKRTNIRIHMDFCIFNTLSHTFVATGDESLLFACLPAMSGICIVSSLRNTEVSTIEVVLIYYTGSCTRVNSSRLSTIQGCHEEEFHWKSLNSSYKLSKFPLTIQCLQPLTMERTTGLISWYLHCFVPRYAFSPSIKCLKVHKFSELQI